MDDEVQGGDRCLHFGLESTDTLEDRCTNYNAAKANRELAAMVSSMGLPKSISPTANCATCDNALDINAVKAFGLRLNAKAIGNVFIEILCPKCSSAYELHYEHACEDFAGFQKFLSEGPFGIIPVASHKIAFWKNNLLEKTLKKQGEE